MIRLALWLLGALLLAGIVHLATVLLLPRMATQDAYARVSAIAPVNAVTPVPSPTPEKAVLPFMDPAFQVSVCRYDLSRGPLKFSVPISQAYTSVSFYTRSDIAYYAINDRAAGLHDCRDRNNGSHDASLEEGRGAGPGFERAAIEIKRGGVPGGGRG